MKVLIRFSIPSQITPLLGERGMFPYELDAFYLNIDLILSNHRNVLHSIMKACTLHCLYVLIFDLRNFPLTTSMYVDDDYYFTLSPKCTGEPRRSPWISKLQKCYKVL